MHFLSQPRGQAIFRIKSLIFRSTQSTDDGQTIVEPVIHKYLDLKTNSSPSFQVTPASSDTQGSAEDVVIWGSTPSERSTVEILHAAQLQAGLDTQREELKQMSTSGHQAVSAFEGAMERLEQKVQQLKHLLDTMRQDSLSRQEALPALETRVSSLEQRKEDLSAVEEMRGQMRSTLKTVDDTGQGLTEIKGLLHGWEKRQQDLAVMQEALVGAQERLDQLSGTADDVSGLNQIVDGLLGTLETLQAEVKSLRSGLGAANDQLEAHSNDVGFTKERLQENSMELVAFKEEARGRFDELSARTEETQKHLQGNSDKLHGLRSELSGTLRNCEATQTELDGLQTEVSGTKDELDATKVWLRRVQETLDEARTEIRGDRDVLANAQEEMADCKGEILLVREQMSRAQKSFHETQKDVDCLRKEFHETQGETVAVQEEVYHLGEDLAKTQGELEEVREELQNTREENRRMGQQLDKARSQAEEHLALSRASASAVSTLQEELQALKAELARERADTTAGDNISLLFHELDVLSRNVSKMGNRANQIETLQMDVELYRNRLQRLECVARPQSASRTHVHCQKPSDPGSDLRDELSEEYLQEGSGQKRTLPDTDNTEFLGATPPKRRAVTWDDSSPESQLSASASGSSPTLMIGPRRSIRQARLGAHLGAASTGGT